MFQTFSFVAYQYRSSHSGFVTSSVFISHHSPVTRGKCYHCFCKPEMLYVTFVCLLDGVTPRWERCQAADYCRKTAVFFSETLATLLADIVPPKLNVSISSSDCCISSSDCATKHLFLIRHQQHFQWKLCYQNRLFFNETAACPAVFPAVTEPAKWHVFFLRDIDSISSNDCVNKTDICCISSNNCGT